MEVEMEAGLMPQIQALIAPPPSETPPKSKRKEREDKRKAKGQNRDTCDACGECGTLICCEYCPTALHLQCQEPPLEEDDVPLGEWSCRACRAKSDKPKDKKCLEEEDEDPIQILINAMEQQNPHRFVISGRYRSSHIFSNADKGPKKVISRRSSSMKKTQTEPAKTCFGCGRGSRAGQLLNCDFCSLSYHLDCLDPPLTVLPLGTWMCPVHAEHFLDANVLSSTSAVDRAKIWAEAAKDLDYEALKLEFIRKVSRQNPPFRYKVKKPERPRAVIPPAVAQMYQNPPPIVPTLPNNVKFDRTWKVDAAPTPEEVNDWLSSLFSMQMSLAWELATKNSKPAVETPQESSNNEMVEELMEQMFSSKKKLNRTAIDNFIAQLELGANATVEAQVAKMDPRLLKLLAAQRLQQVLPQFKDKNNFVTNSLSDTKMKIKEECGTDDVYAVFDDNAFLKNGVICPKKKYVALKDITGGLKLEEWKEQTRCMKPDEELEEGEVTTLVTVRAALAPVGSLLRIAPVTMRYKSLTIGTSPDSDVCLNDFGVCQYTSSKHAKIFYDTMTGEYELLNYSPHGTVVDGCLYCLDATQWRVPSAPAVTDPLTQNVRSILDKRRGIKREAAAAAAVRAPRPLATRRVCGCAERLSDPTGWEGSALLNHCSHIQFGCLQFVFSIVDFAPSKIVNPDEEDKKKRKTDDVEEKPADVEMKE